MVAGSTQKQKLSSLLDADVSRVDVAHVDESGALAGGDPAAYAPATFAEFMQAASTDDLRRCLKSLLDQGEVNEQVRNFLKEEKSHQEWVGSQEEVFSKPPPAAPSGVAAVAEAEDAEDAPDGVSSSVAPGAMDADVRTIPLRLTADERALLGILEGALFVSEYTDQVDVYHAGNKSRRMALQIQQVCAIIAGLVVANNFDVARKPLMERGFADNRHFFRAIFEIGRRYKILNPDKFRGSYGKQIHMLQDSVKDEVIGLVGFECVAPCRTVWMLAKEKTRGMDLLRDPLLQVATREIYEGSKTRAQIQALVKEKSDALARLKAKYAEKPPDDKVPKGVGDLGELLRGKQTESTAMTEENVETIVASIGDHFAFQRFNREPCERMINYLKTYFNPESSREWPLDISRGSSGSCLSHSHRTQYTFVLQSLLLWREIMGNMFALWQATEEDLLDPSLRYRLCDTGQGLNRMQSAPRVSRMMHSILHKVQSEVGGWVGLSVVHLGDRDVPNALVFIDKYTQVPRILGPLVQTLDRLPEVYASTPALTSFFDKEFGGLDVLRRTILQDFFRHGFDGSGDDGGSCVDGRLTSCWNWCSKIEKKKYFPAFLLTGFSGFDGGFEQGLGN